MEYNFKIDLLKVLAILFVILIHCISLETRNAIGGAYYMLQAVPLFMIISGFNFANSTTTKGLELQECYQLKLLIPKFKRIVIPFLIVYLIEVLWILIVKNENLTLYQYLRKFIVGGWGPGSYYVPLMIQLILIVPLLYKVTKEKTNQMLLAMFILNFIFEMIVYKIQLPNSFYRLMLFRYIFVLELGVYYVIKKVTVNKYRGCKIKCVNS